MDRFGNVLFENKEIENERLELMDKEAHYFLGPHLTMNNCTLVLKVSGRRLFFDGARFINCTFDVKQELKNHQQWVAACLKGCRFKGRLSGCDFGYWPEYSSLPGYQHGFIEGCDFSEARLHGCRIMECDPSSIRFPKWPCFTILNPIGRARELNSVKWPGDYRPIIVEGAYRDPPRTTAVTLYAPALAMRLRTTEEAFLDVIKQFDCIVY